MNAALKHPGIVTFGCRLNAYEMRSDPRARRRSGARRRHHLQHLRGDGRSRAPVAPGDPQGAARKPGARRSSSPAARRRPSPKPMPAMDEVDRRARQCRKARSRQLCRFRRRGQRTRARQRHHERDRDRGPVRRLFRRPRARLPAGAERLRPSLHLLHHSLWPREFAQRAHGRGDRRSPPPGRRPALPSSC